LDLERLSKLTRASSGSILFGTRGGEEALMGTSTVGSTIQENPT